MTAKYSKKLKDKYPDMTNYDLSLYNFGYTMENSAGT
jgi:hypothetical protein